MSRIVAVAANTFRETVRARLHYTMVAFAIGLMACGAIMGGISIQQDQKILKDVGLGAMDLFGHLIALLLGVSLVSQEIERRSLYPLLARPLRREEFLLGKFMGLVFTLFVNTVAMTIALYLSLLIAGRSSNLELLKAVYALLLSFSVTVAVALLLASLAPPALASVGTLGLLVAGRLSDVIRNTRQVAPEVPPWLVDIVYYSLPNFRAFDLKTAVVYGDPVPPLHLAWLTAYAVAYMGVALGLALLAFSRRDLK